ncbi:hypothetical protein [Nocardia salmonicida]|uniref:hypothetical protein n=1 Tax=Nocardia salmonicida TaxID=53431 RepID=UPI0007A498F3|nr:hypothetical protein [Nocardia salmonicida]
MDPSAGRPLTWSGVNRGPRGSATNAVKAEPAASTTNTACRPEAPSTSCAITPTPRNARSDIEAVDRQVARMPILAPGLGADITTGADKAVTARPPTVTGRRPLRCDSGPVIRNPAP